MWRCRHPDFTQELPRKLLPTRAKEAQRRRREKREFTRRCLGRLGSSVDLEGAHNPKVAGSNPAPATTQGRETKGVGRDDRPAPLAVYERAMKFFDRARSCGVRLCAAARSNEEYVSMTSMALPSPTRCSHRRTRLLESVTDRVGVGQRADGFRPSVPGRGRDRAWGSGCARRRAGRPWKISTVLALSCASTATESSSRRESR
jgi:hypothetical protein